MDHRHSSPHAQAQPRPKAQRERSNSLPIVEALGCSTPEARLLLAEGRAAVRTRRAPSQRRPADITTFNPRQHLDFLNAARPAQEPEEEAALPSDSRSCHARIPSTSTDDSTSTLVPRVLISTSDDNPSTSSLGDYSANLAKFIKAQLKNIPAYASDRGPPSPLSPRSCPDLSFRAQTPSQSPKPVLLRTVDAPKLIEIPSLRPPLLSQFSAWSSPGDEEDYDVSPLHDTAFLSSRNTMNKDERSPSTLGYYNISGESSFLFTSTPFEDEKHSNPSIGFFDLKSNRSILSPVEISPLYSTDDYPSSSLSHPQLMSDTSSVSTCYFDQTRPFAITPQMKDRVIAAVTPPVKHGKTLTAISPWEGAALANVHDVIVESNYRVHVDGMSFDMQRDFVLPSHVGTPC